jgi:PKD repeat protein
MFCGGITAKMNMVLRVLLVLSLALIVSCSNDNQNAVITAMSPSEVSIGQQNAVGTITGRNLNATAVSLGDGIAVTGFTMKSSSEIEVHYSVSGSAVPGPRTLSLTTTTGTITAAGALTVTSNKVPKAQFTISPSTGSLITIFEFNASSSSDPDNNHLSFAWDFGDGATAQGKRVTHKYKEIGTMNVQLTASDGGGTSVVTRQLEVLKNSPPVISFKVRPGLKGDTNTNFEFDGSATKDPDGRVTDYIWDFGDGSRKKHGAIVNHQYDKKGNYSVTLSAVDNKGQVASDQKEVQVEKATEIVCQGSGSSHPLIIKGTVVAVEPGNWAIVDFGAGHNCGNTYHKCDDFRKWGVSPPAEFYGIVDKMTDRGNGIMGVHNACPYKWPPAIGERVFVFYKNCRQNHCRVAGQ